MVWNGPKCSEMGRNLRFEIFLWSINCYSIVWNLNTWTDFFTSENVKSLQTAWMAAGTAQTTWMAQMENDCIFCMGIPHSRLNNFFEQEPKTEAWDCEKFKFKLNLKICNWPTFFSYILACSIFTFGASVPQCIDFQILPWLYHLHCISSEKDFCIHHFTKMFRIPPLVWIKILLGFPCF